VDRLSSEPHPDLLALRGRVFLTGPPGAGKTTLAVERLRRLIRHGMPLTAILVLLPQRLLATPYVEALNDPALGPAGQVDVITLDGLARRILGLFWPLIGERAGFAQPARPPVFLTVETAQFYLDRMVAPLVAREGYFESLTIEPTRLLSQLLDNLNKAALVGMSLTEVAERLKGAWVGDPAQRLAFDQAAECIRRYREFCLTNNLLDFSLQIETFTRHLYPQPAVQAYLFDRYRHLIVDNLEEDTPAVHDVVLDWVRHCESALIIMDESGGHRIFLGADPASAGRLAAACDRQVVMRQSLVAPPDGLHLAHQIGVSLNRRPPGTLSADPVASEAHFRRFLHRPADEQHRFHPQMLDWAADEIVRLVNEQSVPPGEIVALAPFVGDALRFALLRRLSDRGIPAVSHRPSRALRDEPAARCLLTLLRLAHPGWGVPPPAFDVALALMQAVAGLDLVRARLLTDVVYRPRAVAWLSPYAVIESDLRDRITPPLGQRYDRLRSWILAYQAILPDGELPVDYFLGRLFGEVLAQPGFGFHGSVLSGGVAGAPGPATVLDNARIAHRLVESARQFRQVLAEGPPPEDELPAGARFVTMVERGLLAATYLQSGQMARPDAVLVAPAYSFLMTNRFVDYQVWLDAGSTGWWERIYQPLTHPYVLRRDWPAGQPWTDADEFDARQEALYRLVLGLVHRCRKGVYLGLSDLSEQGYEQRGPLLHAIQSALRRAPLER
jgi:hypothetical protein